jgi:hypothetical protein
MEPEIRFGFHRCNLTHGHHYNDELQALYDEHGFDIFRFEIVADGMTKDEATSLERLMIRRAMPKNLHNKTFVPGRVKYNNKIVKVNREAIRALKGTMYGYEIARLFDVSPSYVSNVMSGKFA